MTKTIGSRRQRVLLAILVGIREKAGLTQRDLAERLKWPRSKVAKIETGEQRIDAIECIIWAKGCEVRPQAFFLLLCRTLERARL